MAGATYERGSGGHVAERIRPVPGSADDEHMQVLAADPASGWRRIPDPDEVPAEDPDGGDPKDPADGPPPDRPAKSASKADWVTYAVAQGVDPAEADAATRDALVERFTIEKEAS